MLFYFIFYIKMSFWGGDKPQEPVDLWRAVGFSTFHLSLPCLGAQVAAPGAQPFFWSTR